MTAPRWADVIDAALRFPADHPHRRVGTLTIAAVEPDDDDHRGRWWAVEVTRGPHRLLRFVDVEELHTIEDLTAVVTDLAATLETRSTP